MAADPLTRAIELIHSGRGQEAKTILQGLIKADLHNIPAWFWYTETCSTTEQRIRILEACIQYNPNDLRVKRTLDNLLNQQKQDNPPPAPQSSSQPSLELPKPPAASPTPQLNTVSTLPPAVPKPINTSAPSSIKPKPKPVKLTAWLMWAFAGIFVIGFVILAVYAWNSMPKDPSVYHHTQPVDYYLYVPRAYKPDGTWPLFIGIHGFGGSGLDCWNLWQSYADNNSFILLCPSLSDSSGGWYQNDGENKVWASINQVQSAYRVAPRFFLVGFSAGAQFVQGFTLNYPQAVQGVAVLSAGNYYPPSPVVAGMTYLVVIGDRDDPIAIQGSQQFANALAQNGAAVDYWLLPGVGHEVTSKAKQLTIDLFRKLTGK